MSSIKQLTSWKIRNFILPDSTTNLKVGQLFSTYKLTLNVEQISFRNKVLKHPVRVLHLSDFHASSAVPLPFIEKAIRMGLELDPDLICITGDFVTGMPYKYREYQPILALLPAAAPTFSCFGNHDGCDHNFNNQSFYDKFGVGQLLIDSGIHNLYNESQNILIGNQEINIAGLSDLKSHGMRIEQTLPRKGDGPEIPIVLMAHNPDTKDEIVNFDWDLMLSGHTHGGQIKLPFWGTPFAPVVDKRFIEGLKQWDDRWIHVTRGIGNVHGIRINCPPQISLLELI